MRARVDAAIAPEDAAVAARVLRTLGSDLQDAPVDLGALDARLRAIAARPTEEQGDADGAADDAPAGHRPPPPTGLRSAMRPRRR